MEKAKGLDGAIVRNWSCYLLADWESGLRHGHGQFLFLCVEDCAGIAKILPIKLGA